MDALKIDLRSALNTAATEFVTTARMRLEGTIVQVTVERAEVQRT
jgi:hypothetical protein